MMAFQDWLFERGGWRWYFGAWAVAAVVAGIAMHSFVGVTIVALACTIVNLCFTAYNVSQIR